jgi:hypothetical protein
MYLEAVELMEDDGKESMALDIFRQAIGNLFSQKKKRKECAFWRQFNEKPSIIPGCPGVCFVICFICFCFSFIICFLISHFHMQPSIHPFIHPSMQSFRSYIQTCNHITDQPWFHLTPGFMLLSGSHIKSTLCVHACVHNPGLVTLTTSCCMQAATSRTSGICVYVCACMRVCVHNPGLVTLMTS